MASSHSGELLSQRRKLSSARGRGWQASRNREMRGGGCGAGVAGARLDMRRYRADGTKSGALRSLCSKLNLTGNAPMNAKVDSLSKTVSSGISQAQDTANDTLDSAKRTMDHAIDRGKDLASDAASAANNALKSAKHAGSELANSASGLASEIQAMAQKNPLTMMIGAVLAGVVMGMMVRGSRD
jgi:hypothetical protein